MYTCTVAYILTIHFSQGTQKNTAIFIWSGCKLKFYHTFSMNAGFGIVFWKVSIFKEYDLKSVIEFCRNPETIEFFNLNIPTQFLHIQLGGGKGKRNPFPSSASHFLSHQHSSFPTLPILPFLSFPSHLFSCYHLNVNCIQSTPWYRWLE